MGKRRMLTVLVGVLLGALLLSGVPAFAQDPFAGLTNTLNSSARPCFSATM